MGGKPFQSKLIPHAAVISAQRRRGRTWREIAEHLTEAGCSTDPGSLCRFFARWKRRPHALGAEPEPEPKPQPESIPVTSEAPPPGAAKVADRPSAVEEARRRAAESQRQKEAESAGGWEAIHTGGPLSKSRPNL